MAMRCCGIVNGKQCRKLLRLPELACDKHKAFLDVVPSDNMLYEYLLANNAIIAVTGSEGVINFFCEKQVPDLFFTDDAFSRKAVQEILLHAPLHFKIYLPLFHTIRFTIHTRCGQYYCEISVEDVPANLLCDFIKGNFYLTEKGKVIFEDHLAIWDHIEPSIIVKILAEDSQEVD